LRNCSKDQRQSWTSRYWGKKGAGIFFTDGEKVLLLKRSKKGDNGGTWGLPGGKAQEGETILGTAMRESKEECGNVEGNRFDSLETVDGCHHWTTFFYQVNGPFDCKLSDEHTKWEWVSLDDLDAYDLHPKLSKEIGRYMKVIGRRFQGLSFRDWLDR
jgi:8-oxo-dGTP pyrophosphatase MutT (NUDIX family)